MYESSFAPVLMFWAVMLVMYSDSSMCMGWGMGLVSPHTAVGDVENLAIFGYCAACYLVALLVEVGGEVVVGIGGVGGLALYEVFDDGFDLSGGYLLAAGLMGGVAGLAGGS